MNMSWIAENAASINALLSVLLVLITGVYVLLTWRLVAESRELRRAQASPEIAISLRPYEGGINFTLLRIENLGGGPALRVRLQTDWQYEEGNRSRLSEVGLFKNGIGYFPPGAKIEHFIANVIGHLEDLKRQPLRIDVEYADLFGRTHSRAFTLDFSELENLSFIGTPPLFEMASSLKKIERDISRLGSGFSRLHVLTESQESFHRRLADTALVAKFQRLSQEDREKVEEVLRQADQAGRLGS